MTFLSEKNIIRLGLCKQIKFVFLLQFKQVYDGCYCSTIVMDSRPMLSSQSFCWHRRQHWKQERLWNLRSRHWISSNVILKLFIFDSTNWLALNVLVMTMTLIMKNVMKSNRRLIINFRQHFMYQGKTFNAILVLLSDVRVYILQLKSL